MLENDGKFNLAAINILAYYGDIQNRRNGFGKTDTKQIIVIVTVSICNDCNNAR
jgi:hypothetical protein